MKIRSCPTREELHEYNVGKLAEQAALQLMEHLETCPRCEETLAGLGDRDDTLVAALQQPVPADPLLDEPQLDAVLSLIESIGLDPTETEGREASASGVPVAELGRIGVYQLLQKLGEGGMGAVYKALHTKLDKIVALKVLPARRMQDDGAVARFEREMRAAGRLDHANIVRASDADEEDGVHYLVMEYVDGWDLSQLIHRHGPLPAADACELIRQAAVGLQHAHEHGLVHRDIKPSNLMLAVSTPLSVQSAIANPKSAIVKILDLGLALLEGPQAEAPAELTATDQMMGTLDYMAPEQGAHSHDVDIRADIYSLGATLYKLLCGQAPFAGQQYNTPLKKLMALAGETPAPIGQRRHDLPDGLAAIVDRMLARNPADRFATPREVAEALEPYAQGCDLTALVERLDRRAGRTEAESVSVGTTPVASSTSVDTTETADLVAPDVAHVEATTGGQLEAQPHAPSPSPPRGEGRGEGAISTPSPRRLVVLHK
jgi:serine/threonine protein kinase